MKKKNNEKNNEIIMKLKNSKKNIKQIIDLYKTINERNDEIQKIKEEHENLIKQKNTIKL